MAIAMAVRSFLQSSAQQTSKDIPLTPSEALSGIFGAISLVSWIFVFIPQLIENYKQQSAAGISMLFIFIWFVGDAANLAGAIWAELVPTIIAIAIYYVFSDVVIASQCAYYNILNARKEKQRRRTASADTGRTDATEDEPLLSRRDSNQSIGLPGSHKRRRSSAARSTRTQESAPQSANGALAKIAEEDALRNGNTAKKEFLKNTACIVILCVVGAVAWVVCWKVGIWTPTPAPEDAPSDGEGESSGRKSTPIGAEILGYISAFLYLAARIPQILKNWREQSCEGLSLLFFLLSLLGNLTYGASILFHSVQKDYVITNLPWLIGSLGTMVEDSTIFVQFRLYGEGPKAAEESSSAVE